MASVLIFATKKTSTTVNSDSITISRIMGTDNMKIARLMLPDVKLVSEPRNAARNNRINLVIEQERCAVARGYRQRMNDENRKEGYRSGQIIT